MKETQRKEKKNENGASIYESRIQSVNYINDDNKTIQNLHRQWWQWCQRNNVISNAPMNPPLDSYICLNNKMWRRPEAKRKIKQIKRFLFSRTLHIAHTHKHTCSSPCTHDSSATFRTKKKRIHSFYDFHWKRMQFTQFSCSDGRTLNTFDKNLLAVNRM